VAHALGQIKNSVMLKANAHFLKHIFFVVVQRDASKSFIDASILIDSSPLESQHSSSPCHTPAASPSLLIFKHNVGASSTNDTFLLNLETLAWTALPSLLSVANATAACDKSHLYIVGGWMLGGLTAQVAVLDIHQRKWTFLPVPMTVARRSSAAVVTTDRNLVVIGGYNPSMNGELATVEACDLKRVFDGWQKLPSMTTARSGCSAVMNESNLIVMGGYNGVETENLSTGEVFSFDSYQWAPFPIPMTCPRQRFGMVYENNRLFVIGGRNLGRLSDSGEYFDFKCNIWRSLLMPHRTKPGSECGATIHDNKLFVCYCEQLFILDVESQEWTELPLLPDTYVAAVFFVNAKN
jgi:hypothetical protein